MKAQKIQDHRDGSRNPELRGGLLLVWLKDLNLVVKGDRRQFTIVLAVGLATNAFIGLTNPIAIKLIFDEGIIKKRFAIFIMYSLFFLVFFTLWRGILYWYRLYLQDFKNRTQRTLTLEMLHKFYSLPYPTVIRQENGYFVSRIYDETTTMVLPIIDCTTSMVNSSISFVASFVLTLLLSWRATFVLLIIVPAIYVLSSQFGARLKRSTKREKEQEARFRGTLARAVSAYKIIRVFGLQERVVGEAAAGFEEFLQAFRNRFRDSSLYLAFSGLCSSWTESIVTVVAGYEVLSGRMTFGGFMAFLSAFWMSTAAIRQVLEQAGELPRIIASVERMKEFDVQDAVLPVAARRVLELKEAAFGYEPGSDLIFDGLNLKVRMSEKVLIVGPNGAGKSTLVNVLAGFLNVSSGNAHILSLDRISVMTFPMAFAPGTVRANLSFGNGVVRRDILDQLIKQFGIADLVDRDPSELSAGQQQRVYLVIALLKDADFYILDEPLSHIDVEARPLILDNILRYTEHKGLISIMHGDVQLHDRFNRIVSLDKRL